ncbi:MAG: hypothetical protein Q9187_000040 [Circinaria calcarea]
MSEFQNEAVVAPRAEESNASKQARLRRERREAKIKAGGSARLEKITNLSGRPVEPAQPTTDALPPHPYPQSPLSSEDPEEIDITNHPFTSFRTPDGTRSPDPRQLLRGSQAPHMSGSRFDIPGQQGQGGMGGEEEDPMMRILQQMMGGMPGGAEGTREGADGGLPPGLAAMLGGAGMGETESVQQDNTFGSFWKIIHALFAFSLGIYITAMTSFSGSRLSRSTLVEREHIGVQFFWVFATAELILQSSRFFLERGKAAQVGILATVAGFLPEPWKGYVGLVNRYSGIYTTIVEDAMAVVFVLGLVAWWQGLAG